MIGASGRGAVGNPSSSTSGRLGPSGSAVSFSGEAVGAWFRTDIWERLWRRIGGGTASSSLSVSSCFGSGAFSSSSTGPSH